MLSKMVLILVKLLVNQNYIVMLSKPKEYQAEKEPFELYNTSKMMLAQLWKYL